MKISVKEIFEIVGLSKDFAGELDLSWITRQGEQLFPDALAVSGQIANRAGIVTLRYQISGKLPFRCDRCLMQSELVINEEYEHIVVQSLEDETLDDAYLTAPDGVLTLDEIAGADIQLSLPQVMLCKEDCKGLCPMCGADLNKESCGCKPDDGDPRMAVLKNLLKG